MVIDQMTELTLPLALVIGDGDKAYLGANNYMEKKLPHAQRTTVEGARHYVMRSHPESVATAIRSMSAAARDSSNI
jgi:pimeloyl-ACP methyl ester carboxylesterase